MSRQRFDAIDLTNELNEWSEDLTINCNKKSDFLTFNWNQHYEPDSANEDKKSCITFEDQNFLDVGSRCDDDLNSDMMSKEISIITNNASPIYINGKQKFTELNYLVEEDFQQIFYSKNEAEKIIKDSSLDSTKFAKHFYSNGREKYIGEVKQNSEIFGRGRINHSNGNKKFVGYFGKRAKSYGREIVEYTRNGEIKFIGEKDEGKKEGYSEEYFEHTNNLQFYGNYKEDKKLGYGTAFNWAGYKEYKGYYDNDVYNGRGIKLGENGVILYCGYFKDSRKRGREVVSYLLNGKISEIGDYYENSSKEGYAEVFHSIGNLKYNGNFQDNLLNAEETEEYYSNPLTTISQKDVLKQTQKPDPLENMDQEEETKTYIEPSVRKFVRLRSTEIKSFENCLWLKYHGGFSNGEYNGKGILYQNDFLNTSKFYDQMQSKIVASSIVKSGTWKEGEFIEGKKYTKNGYQGSIGKFNIQKNLNFYISEALDEKYLEEGGVLYQANGRLNKRLQWKFRCGRLDHYFIEYYKNGQPKCIGNIYFDYKGNKVKSYNNFSRY